MHTKAKLISIALLLLPFSPMMVGATEVTANITGIENDEGVIRATLYSEAIQDQFPDGKALEEIVADAKKDGVSVTFNIAEPGIYAIAVMQDEDNDGKMKTGFLGIPKEPYGNSGEYAKLKPKFKNSKFLVEEQDLEMTIKVH